MFRNQFGQSYAYWLPQWLHRAASITFNFFFCFCLNPRLRFSLNGNRAQGLNEQSLSLQKLTLTHSLTHNSYSFKCRISNHLRISENYNRIKNIITNRQTQMYTYILTYLHYTYVCHTYYKKLHNLCTCTFPCKRFATFARLFVRNTKRNLNKYYKYYTKKYTAECIQIKEFTGLEKWKYIWLMYLYCIN